MHVEPDTEALLLRLVPGLDAGWVGASDEGIQLLEALAGRALPPFYHWFLSKMGNSVGPFASSGRDMSVRTIVSAYREHVVLPDPRFFLIALESADPMMPMQVFYDLGTPARDDALVVSRPARGGGYQRNFETLREMLARYALRQFRINRCAQRCDGRIVDDDGDVLAKLAPVLDGLGFAQPVATGSYCGLFERSDAAFAGNVPPEDGAERMLVFSMGAADAGALRSILGHVTTQTDLDVTIRAWTPPLRP